MAWHVDMWIWVLNLEEWYKDHFYKDLLLSTWHDAFVRIVPRCQAEQQYSLNAMHFNYHKHYHLLKNEILNLKNTHKGLQGAQKCDHC